MTTSNYANSARSITTAPILPCTLYFWTWREAAEVASRVQNAQSRIKVKRHDNRWVVQYDALVYLMNAV